jgi:hypothetical protein
VRRRNLIALITLGVIIFLAVSALLARAFSADGAERSAVTALVQAEARGDQAAMLSDLLRCRTTPGCPERVAEDIAALRRPGPVSIPQLQTSTGFSLTGTTGTARVVWKVPSSLPIVQCVRVRRAGDVLSGLHVELLRISPRIKTDADCPARF